MAWDFVFVWYRAAAMDCAGACEHAAVSGIPSCDRTRDLLRIYRIQQLLFHPVLAVLAPLCEDIPDDDPEQTYH